MVTNGTDTPVEDVDPIQSFYGAVSRRTKDGAVFVPEQRVSREEALRAYTLNNAFAAFEEKEKGSLSAGKLADIVVLSKNILTVPESEIPSARVDLTLLGGVVRMTPARRTVKRGMKPPVRSVESPLLKPSQYRSTHSILPCGSRYRTTTRPCFTVGR